MKKYKVKIREVIEHIYEVEEFNEYMAKEAAIKLLRDEMNGRVWHSHNDIFVEEKK